MIPTPAAPIQLFDTMRMRANPIIPASSPATGGIQGLEFFFGFGETIRPVPLNRRISLFPRPDLRISSNGFRLNIRSVEVTWSLGGVGPTVEDILRLMKTLNDAWNKQDWETFMKRHAAWSVP